MEDFRKYFFVALLLAIFTLGLFLAHGTALAYSDFNVSSSTVYSIWQLDNSVADDAAHSDFTWAGSSAYASGKFDNAASFSGASSLLNGPNLSGVTKFALSFWFKTGTGTEHLWSANGNNGGSPDYFFIELSSGHIYYELRVSGVSYTVSDTSKNYADNAWHFVVVTWDGVTGTPTSELYTDGSSIGTASSAGTTSLNLAQCHAFGYYCLGASNYFSGLIDNIASWTALPTSGNVSTIWSSGSGERVTYGLPNAITLTYPVSTTTSGNFSNWTVNYSYSLSHASSSALSVAVVYSKFPDFSSYYVDSDPVVYSPSVTQWAFAHSQPLDFGTWYAYPELFDNALGPTPALVTGGVTSFTVSATGTTPWADVINSTTSVPIIATSSWSTSFDSLCVTSSTDLISDVAYGLCRTGLFLVAPHNFSLQFIQNSFANFQSVFPFNLLFGILNVERNAVTAVTPMTLTQVVTWPDNTTSSLTWAGPGTLETIFGKDNANWIFNFVLMLMIVFVVWNAKRIIL